jgi:hypothetical protein
VERRRVVGKIANVEICSPRDEELDRGVLIVKNGEVQRRRLLESAAKRVDHLRMFVEMRTKRRDVSALSRRDERADRPHFVF